MKLARKISFNESIKNITTHQLKQMGQFCCGVHKEIKNFWVFLWIQKSEWSVFVHLGDLLEILMPFLQCSGPVQGLAHPCVLAEEGLPVVLDPVQHLRTGLGRQALHTGQHSIHIGTMMPGLGNYILGPASCVGNLL